MNKKKLVTIIVAVILVVAIILGGVWFFFLRGDKPTKNEPKEKIDLLRQVDFLIVPWGACSGPGVPIRGVGIAA